MYISPESCQQDTKRICKLTLPCSISEFTENAFNSVKTANHFSI